MIDGGERHPQHTAVSLIGAIIGMLVPCDIREQAGRVTQAPFLIRFLAEQRSRPIEKLGTKIAEAPHCACHATGIDDQRIEGTILRV
jgi:hypothetical protein